MSSIVSQGKAFLSNYEVERIIVDSDFDGVMCGAMLRIVFPKSEILQSKASDIQEGLADHLINKQTLLADLRYSPLCGYFFDHHVSNKPEADFIGAWSPEPSAAQVIYSYFKDAGDFSNFENLIEDINKFDSGNLTLEEFKNPSSVFQLALVINRDEAYFNLWLIELLAKFPLEKVCEHPFVQKRIIKYLDTREKMKKYVQNNSEVSGRIAFVDLRGYIREEKMASYVFTSLFPEASVVVVVKPHEDEQFVKVRLYKNNFFAHDEDLDLLGVAKTISPDTAGGHKGACGLTLESSFDKDKLMEEVRGNLQIM